MHKSRKDDPRVRVTGAVKEADGPDSDSGVYLSQCQQPGQPDLFNFCTLVHEFYLIFHILCILSTFFEFLEFFSFVVAPRFALMSPLVCRTLETSLPPVTSTHQIELSSCGDIIASLASYRAIFVSQTSQSSSVLNTWCTTRWWNKNKCNVYSGAWEKIKVWWNEICILVCMFSYNWQ